MTFDSLYRGATMGRFILFSLFLLIGCADLEPEARRATFILFDNPEDVDLYFIVDSVKHTVYAHERVLYPVNPGNHIVDMGGKPWGPEKIYIAPCQVETLRFDISTN
jgi:hypothetical protein